MGAAFSFASFFRDMRYALRQLRNQRAFALAVIATIALGMGATVGVFNVVHSVLLRPLPYKNSSRLVVAFGDMRRRNASDLALSSPDFQDLRSETTTMFEGFAGEIGVRLAIGAPRRRIFSLVVGHGLALGTAGIFIGSLLALALAHWISSLLVETKPTDPLTFFGIAVALLLIVVAAAWLPARRAALVDPMQALRSE